MISRNNYLHVNAGETVMTNLDIGVRFMTGKGSTLACPTVSSQAISYKRAGRRTSSTHEDLSVVSRRARYDESSTWLPRGSGVVNTVRRGLPSGGYFLGYEAYLTECAI